MEKKKKGKGLLQEFKEFISRGSVMDLAVGVIIGGAFTAIVNALVENILNPIIGLVTGGMMDFSNLKIPLSADPVSYTHLRSILGSRSVRMLVKEMNPRIHTRTTATKMVIGFFTLNFDIDVNPFRHWPYVGHNSVE